MRLPSQVGFGRRTWAGTSRGLAIKKFKVSGKPAGGSLPEAGQRGLWEVTFLSCHKVTAALRIKPRNQTQLSVRSDLCVTFTLSPHSTLLRVIRTLICTKYLFSTYTCTTPFTPFNQQNNYRREKSYRFSDEETN